MAQYSRAKDFHRLLVSLESFIAGQASLVAFDESCLSSLSIMLAPTDGLYAGGKFVFEVGVDFPTLLILQLSENRLHKNCKMCHYE